MYGFILNIGVIFVFNKIGLGNFFAEHGRKVFNLNPVLFCGGNTLAAAGYGIRSKPRAFVVGEYVYVDIKNLGAFVQKGKRKIGFTFFVI